MKNIHVLAADKPSRLYYNRNDKSWQLCEFPKYHTDIKSTHNIYITSDEEINFDEYYLGADNNIYCLVSTVNSNGKKVILSTDQDLIKDGVQAIDDEFLEWFVNNPSYEEIEVDYGFFTPFGRKVDPMGMLQNHSKCVWKYKIIIPKEEETKCYCGHTTYCDCGPEETKQETLEEAFKNCLINKEFEVQADYIAFKGAEFGAKWQQERSYSEEEVENIVNKTVDKFCTFFSYDLKQKVAKEWFEQFKKK